MKRWLAGMAAGVMTLVSACTVGSGPPVKLTEVRVPTVSTYGSFDGIDIDQQKHRLYVADRTDAGVDVIDLTSSPATFTHTIVLGSSPNGLAYAPDLKRLFVGEADGSVAIIDEHEKVIKQVPAGGQSIDLIDYSPSTHEVFAGISDNSVARIDAVKGEIKNVIKIPGAVGLEQPRYNPVDNLLWVTSPSKNLLFAVDPIGGAVQQRVELGNCAPKGIAINPKTDQALVVCRTWVQRVNLGQTGDQQPFAEVEGGDIVNYYPASDRFLVGMPDASPSGVAVLSGNPIRFIATAHTSAHGNSAALDEATRIVYSPDTRAGTAGLVAFKLPTQEPAFSIDAWAVLELAVVLAVIALVVAVIGRGGDPVNRPEPLPVPPRRRRSWSRN